MSSIDPIVAALLRCGVRPTVVRHDELEQKHGAGSLDDAAMQTDHASMKTEDKQMQQEHQQLVEDHKKIQAEHAALLKAGK